MLGTATAEGLGRIGGCGAGTGHSGRGPVQGRMAGCNKQE